MKGKSGPFYETPCIVALPDNRAKEWPLHMLLTLHGTLDVNVHVLNTFMCPSI